MEIGIIVIGVVAVAIIFLFFYFVPVGLWLTAVFSGVRVSIATLVGMRLRKVSPPILS
ncbi:MAG TPA: flotillin-like FloA family protein, partial [Dehalococcoidia bacterium]|nr:flotillin-like FloA family protein [Dehalococcoidia bacterium]